MDRALHMSDFFTYSSKNLVDQPVIAMNGDIILGDGFDSIDTQRLRDEKVMYSLSRYEREKPTQTCHKKNMVLAKGYQFSHDTHVFRLAEPLNETLILDKLDYPINMWGAENAMIYTFKFDLHFTVSQVGKIASTCWHVSQVDRMSNLLTKG
ncbi:hypothetical protein EB796_006936 [Bugula neritina]|uniref:Uncharacterized protein n=1 Tax=Bugula neritina TaxID=10212 RepID=A0A7J7K946_BUGNE|nr:hypothetical protein EB796_006936 [Bugula neritina]